MSPLLQPGQMISQYRLRDRIGAGGMGEVFLAIDTRVNRRVALKFLNAPAQRRDLFDRFRNEARLHAKLFHPNIARMFGFVGDAVPPYLVMEYVAGPTLKDWIEQARGVGWPERLRVFAGIADGVGYLHANGIVHRDIKPANVRLTRDGQPKLLDFGIAKDPQTLKMTTTGHLVGTLQYMAPELFGRNSATPRSDVWALGVMLYELLTRRLPFASDSLDDLISEVRKCRFPPPTGVDAALPVTLDKLVKSCIRSNPDDRPPDGTAFAAAVRAVIDGAGSGASSGAGRGRAERGDAKGGSPSPGRPARPAETQSRRWPTPPTWALIAGAIALLGSGGGLYALFSGDRAVIPQAPSCDQVAGEGATFPVKITGDGGLFEVWVNGIKCGTTGAEGVSFRAVPGNRIDYECRPVAHGAVTTHTIFVGATNDHSCP